MAERVFIFVDGESHYIRTEKAWEALHGPDATMERLRYVGKTEDKRMVLVPKATVFWVRNFSADADRTVYFTSAVADPPGMHDIRVQLRNLDLEPQVVYEEKKLAERRKNKLRDAGVIEKPKGVDISLTVRMLVDAFRPHPYTYDRCHLYTSDPDFIPVIKAVMGEGKRVWVYGYEDSLKERSELLHVPDLFVDLGKILSSDCELAPEVCTER